MLRVAREWGVRPSEVMDWDESDQALAAGLLLHEAEIGPHGQPFRLALDPDNDGWFEVEPVKDFEHAAIDRWLSEKDREPGVQPVVRFVRDV